MRIRDIDSDGFYARIATEEANVGLRTDCNRKLTFQALHIAGICPMFIPALARFAFVPMTATDDGGLELMDPDVLFGAADDWRLLCDGSEPDFGPHTMLMKLLELGGYSSGDARRIARNTLVQSLDRQIYGSAQENCR